MTHYGLNKNSITLMVGCVLAACGGATSDDDVINNTVSGSGDNVTSILQTPATTPEGQFNIIASMPANNSNNMATSENILITFEEPVFTSTVNNNTVQLIADNRLVAADLQYSQGSMQLVIDPQNDLQSNKLYEVRFSNDLMSVDGGQLAQNRIRFTTAGDMGSTPETVAQGCMTSEDVDMLKQINAARSQARNCGGSRFRAVAPVSFNCQLKEAATRHSLDMARTGNFSHTGTDGSNFSRRIEETGYDRGAGGENIAWGQRSVTEVMNGWIDSPGHCSNIMSELFTEVGTSMEPNQSGRLYWTQNFARPL